MDKNTMLGRIKNEWKESGLSIKIWDKAVRRAWKVNTCRHAWNAENGQDNKSIFAMVQCAKCGAVSFTGRHCQKSLPDGFFAWLGKEISTAASDALMPAYAAIEERKQNKRIEKCEHRWCHTRHVGSQPEKNALAVGIKIHTCRKCGTVRVLYEDRETIML